MDVEAPTLCKGAKSVPCAPYIVGVKASTPSEGQEQNPFSLRAGTLSDHFPTVIHWHRTLFLLFWIGFDENFKLSAVCN